MVYFNLKIFNSDDVLYMVEKCNTMAKPVEYKINCDNSNQIKMDSDNKEKSYCDDDGEYRIYCQVFDNFAIDRYYNNQLKTQTHINNFRERQQLNITNNSSLFSTTINALVFEKTVSFN